MGKSTMGSTGDVYIQDQSTDRLSLFLGQILDTVTIITNTNKDDESLDVESSGYVPVVGNFICMQEQGKITQVEIVLVTLIAGNQYTLDIAVPLDYPYTIAGGCSIQNVDMNIDGSTTPVNFSVNPYGNYRWDITRMMIGMVLATAGDDGKFGNLTALTKGLFMRKEDSENSQNLMNIKDNSDFRLEGYDVTYPPRSGGGGDYGMAARISYSGQDKAGVVIRLSGKTGDSYRATVRSDLLSLGKFRIKIQGHVVSDA